MQRKGEESGARGLVSPTPDGVEPLPLEATRPAPEESQRGRCHHAQGHHPRDRARGRPAHLLSHRRLPAPRIRNCTLDEVLTGLDERTSLGGVKRIQTGVHHLQRSDTELLFVTLGKSEKDDSPTTLHNDHAISETSHQGPPAGRRNVRARKCAPGAAGARTRAGRQAPPCLDSRHAGRRPLTASASRWRCSVRGQRSCAGTCSGRTPSFRTRRSTHFSRRGCSRESPMPRVIPCHGHGEDRSPASQSCNGRRGASGGRPRGSRCPLRSGRRPRRLRVG